MKNPNWGRNSLTSTGAFIAAVYRKKDQFFRQIQKVISRTATSKGNDY